MKKILTVFGTRPEAIKMAPVIRELERHPGEIISRICVTAQHREMLDQVLHLFEIEPDHDLDLMRPNQSLNALTARVFSELDSILEIEDPDWVLVQGDTTTVMAASIAAFYRRIKVGHVEAGRRTCDKWQPYPEEIKHDLRIVLYGPLAITNVKALFDESIEYFSSAQECLAQSGVSVLTYRSPEFKQAVESCVPTAPLTLVDGCRLIDPASLDQQARYVPLGRHQCD
jgi:hypothetical protein